MSDVSFRQSNGKLMFTGRCAMYNSKKKINCSKDFTYGY